MISTRFILSTGLKKWIPTKLDGRALARARPAIGSVDVLLAKKPPGASIGSASRVTCAFSSRFSYTASMISSQPDRSWTRSVALMRASRAVWSAALMRPWSTRNCVSLALYSLPASALGRLTSFKTVAMLRLACTWAMPAPIIPAPRMPTFCGLYRADVPGRLCPDLMAFMLKKNVLIMFFATEPTTSRVR